MKTPKFFFAVGPHYALFGQVDDTEVVRLLAENRLERGADAALAVAPRGKP